MGFHQLTQERKASSAAQNGVALFLAKPEFTSTGLWLDFENKGMSSQSGNKQVTDRSKTLPPPSVLAAWNTRHSTLINITTTGHAGTQRIQPCKLRIKNTWKILNRASLMNLRLAKNEENYLSDSAFHCSYW